MRPLLLAFSFLYLLSLSLAAPTTPLSNDGGAQHTGLVATSSHLTSASTSQTHTSSTSHTSARPRVPSHKPHPTPLPPVPVGTDPQVIPTHSRPPSPPHPFPGVPSPNSPLHHSSGQKPISIAFEVLGGVIAGLLLLSFLRCCNNYRKTPGRDRIAEIVHRHNLQRELEELERNPRALRRPSLPEPAPPYFPRPPSYETPPSQHLASSHSQRSQRSISPSEYSAVSAFSPPSTPPMSEVPLPSVAVSRRGHPQYPSG